MRKCLVLVVVVFSFLAVGCSDETDNEIREPIIVREDIVVDDVGVLQFQADKPLQERFKSVKLGMTYEEVMSIMGYPHAVWVRQPIADLYWDTSRMEHIERYLHVEFHMSLGMVVVGKISSKSKPGNNNTQWILD